MSSRAFRGDFTFSLIVAPASVITVFNVHFLSSSEDEHSVAVEVDVDTLVGIALSEITDGILHPLGTGVVSEGFALAVIV